MYIYNLYLLSFILMLYRAPIDTSPVTEGVALFKHQLLLNVHHTDRSLRAKVYFLVKFQLFLYLE